jgi:hypothetical protein
MSSVFSEFHGVSGTFCYVPAPWLPEPRLRSNELSDPGYGKRICLLLTTPRRPQGPTQPPIQRFPGKVAWTWSWPPTSSVAEVKNVWSYASLPLYVVTACTETTRNLPVTSHCIGNRRWKRTYDVEPTNLSLHSFPFLHPIISVRRSYK